MNEILFQYNVSTVTFEASTNTEGTLPQYFSFDSQSRISPDFQNNDIFFSVGGNTNVFLVFMPLVLAQGMYVENVDPEGIITFNIKDCESGNYSMGSRPIPEINSKYCWKTNDGNLVEFVVTDILQIIDDQMTYQVTIKYVLWE